MRYAVTGAAGFIGSHLGDALVEAGQDVVGLDSFTDYYDPALKEENARGLDVRRVDLADAPLDFAGLDGVFHLAGQPGPRQRPDMAFARMVAAAANGDEFELYGDGSQSRSFTFVRDVVDATIRALDAAPGIYNVGGGEESTMREALALLEEVAGRPLRV